MPIYPPAFDPSLPEAAIRAAAERATRLPCSELVAQFDSFGNDCEFGFVQRRCGAEPLGPFRFSNPEHGAILRAVTSGFEGFDDVELALDRQQPRREWIVVNHTYGLREHTAIFEGDQDESAILPRQRARVAFLRRLAVDHLREGAKIHVIKSGQGSLTPEICNRLAEAMQRVGPNTLLWVEPGEQVGRVDILGQGLLKGTIDRLTVQPDGPKFSLSGWLAVLTQAWRTAQGMRAHGHTPAAASLVASEAHAAP